MIMNAKAHLESRPWLWRGMKPDPRKRRKNNRTMKAIIGKIGCIEISTVFVSLFRLSIGLDKGSLRVEGHAVPRVNAHGLGTLTPHGPSIPLTHMDRAPRVHPHTMHMCATHRDWTKCQHTQTRCPQTKCQHTQTGFLRTKCQHTQTGFPRTKCQHTQTGFPRTKCQHTQTGFPRTKCQHTQTRCPHTKCQHIDWISSCLSVNTHRLDSLISVNTHRLTALTPSVNIH